MKNYKFLFLIFVSILTSLVFFRFISVEKDLIYTSFDSLKWQNSEVADAVCKSELNSPIDSLSKSLEVEARANCRTDNFIIRNKFLSLHYASSNTKDKNLAKLRVFTGERFEKQIGEFTLGSNEYSWTRLSLDLSKFVGDEVVLEFESGDTRSFIRSRVDYYSGDINNYNFYAKNWSSIAAELILKLIAIFGGIYVLFRLKLKSLETFLMFLFLSIVQFFSFDLFYYFDDWLVFYRYQTETPLRLFSLHNGHSIPLLLIWHSFITKIIEEHYWIIILISNFLHSINAFLIYRLLLRIGFDVKKSLIAAIFFLLSALHLEVVKWGFEQCIILCFLFGLTGIHFHLNYLKSKNIKNFFLSFLLLFSAAFFFANGLMFPICALLVASLNSRISYWKQVKNSKHVFLALIMSVFIYLKLQVRENSFTVDSYLNEYVLSFIYNGFGIGTLLRALSLEPNLKIRTLDELLEAKYSICNYLVQYFKPDWIDSDMFVSSSVVFLFLAFYVYKFWNRKNSFENKVACIAFLMVVISLVLPALGRSYSEFSYLSLRYQYFSLFGLAILVASVMPDKIQLNKNKFLIVLLCLWSSKQIFITSNYKYFEFSGLRHFAYFNQLKDWNTKISKINPTTTFFAEGTNIEGLYPLKEDSIAPVVDAKELYEASKYLNTNEKPYISH